MNLLLKVWLLAWAARPVTPHPLHEGDGATLENMWQHWEWRPAVILVLAVMAGTYGLGWWRLRRQGHRRLASGWRLTAYLSGLAVLAAALLSAIDALQSLLFTMHMVQHELLMMVAPPLLLLGDPFPIVLWVLPAGLRRTVGRLLTRGATFRRVLYRFTAPWVAWALYVAILWIWHSPSAYDVALRNEVIHDLEHLSFFAAALLFWWHVTAAAPHIHGSMGYGVRIGYVLAALAQNEILAVSIALARQPLYTYYTTVPRLWGLSVLDDQKLGGAIMWIPGGMMYVLTAIILLACLLDWEEKKTRREMSGDMHSLTHVVL
ncbi:MAG: cytochrome c oxidase assembly protein [Anaerolineae bacterium]